MVRGKYVKANHEFKSWGEAAASLRSSRREFRRRVSRVHRRASPFRPRVARRGGPRRIAPAAPPKHVAIIRIAEAVSEVVRKKKQKKR